MDKKVLIEYCEISSKEKLKTTKALFDDKRYADCLFFCHLTLELLIKGIIVKKTNKPFPAIHDLPKLTKLTGLRLTKEMAADLEVINSFNIRARYDDYKRSFYKKANRSFTSKYLDKTLQFIKWFKTQ